MTENYNQLLKILKAVFELDKTDLDFGIYKILHARHREIDDFLKKRLLPQVGEIIQKANFGDRAKLQKELDAAIAQAKELGADPENLPKVVEIRQKIAAAPDASRLEGEIFDHLAAFFKRYYKDGDFISLRRYKEGAYAIPYEGEEVKLHWANHDQYYIKTTENLKNYAFRPADNRLVRFVLTEATAAKDNQKEDAGKERRFRLDEDRPFEADENGQLSIYFTFEPSDKKETQAELNAAAFEFLKTKLPADWQPILLAKASTAKDETRTVLQKHLRDFTAKNSFDYFIHKDLGKFLTRELDFYIKNEVLHLEDVQAADLAAFQKQLVQLQAIREIGGHLIAMLAQLENFQKRIWLKKKFVTACHYCITLDRIDAAFYPEIAASAAQVNYWITHFAIDQIKKPENGEQISMGQAAILPFELPLSVGFLAQNRFLPVDTAFFSEDFKNRLLATFDDIDTQTDGLLINSENFQALSLLQARFAGEVKCVYIDPPYNTAASEILYKNEYKTSSWLTLMDSRIELGKTLLAQNGVHCVTIDDFQYPFLKEILDQAFPQFLGTATIRNNPSGRPTPNGFAIAHEYGIFHSKDSDVQLKRFERSDDLNKRYKEEDEKGIYMWELLRKRGSESERAERPTLYYPLFVNDRNVRLPKLNWDEASKIWNLKEHPNENEVAVWPIDEEGVERRWRVGIETMTNQISEIKAEKGKNGQITIYYRYRPPVGISPTTAWIDSKYSATEHGTGVLKRMFSEFNPFSFPKSIHAVQDSIYLAGLSEKSITLDYFAGSGTTAHAVLNLNREDGGHRKYILVEMGQYFETVTKPRVLKAAYSADWKDGKPVGRAGLSQVVKYLQLESYEDALNNLRLQRTAAQQAVLDLGTAATDEHMLHYWLDVETRDHLLGLEMFQKPFDYRLNLTENNETRPSRVDLVETFNYLIGLRVATSERVGGFHVVTGRTAKGEKTLIIWRDLVEKKAADLNAFFEKRQLKTRDSEFQRIYVNGDHHLENLRLDDDQWKVELIERVFLERMFEQ